MSHLVEMDVDSEVYEYKKKHNICRYDSCWKKATFGITDTTLAKRCKEHSFCDDISTKWTMCQGRDKGGSQCKTKPSYGPEGSTVGVRCKKHSYKSDVRVYKKKERIDVEVIVKKIRV